MSSLFEYQKELDALHFTAEQKKVIAATAVKNVQEPTRPARRPAGRTLLIAAVFAAVLATGVGAGASGILKTAVEALKPVFGDETAKTEVIDKIGRPIGAEATQNGVTVTADAIIGDACNACVVYTISRVDGTSLLPQDMPEAGVLTWESFGKTTIASMGGGYGSSHFFDENPQDGAIQYMETITSDTPLHLEAITTEFENLGYWEDGETFVPIAQGKWKLKFSAAYEDSSITLGGGETFTQGSLNFTITGITVSPIAISVAYEVTGESGGPEQHHRAAEQIPILLSKADGTVIDMSLSGGSVKLNGEKKTCTKGGILPELVPLEELASISVGGIEYPLPKNKTSSENP